MFGIDDLLLGGALTGGSMLANIFADEERRKQREIQMRNADYANALYDQRSWQLNEQARNRYANFGADQAATGAKLGDYFSNRAPIPLQGGSGKASSGIMAAENAKQMGQAAAFTNQQGKALGELRAFDQTLGTANRGVLRDAGYLNQNLSNQRHMMNLLPAQLAEAQSAGGFAGTLADLLRGGGRIALSHAFQPTAQGGSEMAAGLGSLFRGIF